MRLPLALILALGLPAHAQAAEVLVFAAASLRTALDEIAAGWETQTGNHVVLSYGGSAKLAQQALAGAPADLFLSASTEWMDVVDDAGALAPDTRRDLLGNALVLVGTEAGAVALADLPERLGDEHLAMGQVDSVPAGQYGKAALEHLGIWDRLSGQIAQTDNVRAALALVATGEAPFGIVYATDARAEPRVHLAATFPAESHPPITYPVARLKDAPAPEAAQAFLDYLASPAAIAVFEGQGFTMIAAP